MSCFISVLLRQAVRVTVVPGLELLFLDSPSVRHNLQTKDEPARLCSRALVLYENKGRRLGSLCFYLISQQSQASVRSHTKTAE